MIFKTLPILAAAASLAAIAPAHAQTYLGSPNADPPSTTVGEVVVTAPFETRSGRELKSTPVYFDDLDLTSPEGGYTLLTRIRGAARQVCQPASDVHDLADTSDYQRCVRRAVDHAVNDVDAPSVQDAYYDLGVGTADLPNG
ncbi:MAG TPA: UrcA family protein [Caulobacteraceae bacterium]|nr:UrcA family protein [Caulobacteraceae bacterium]